MLGASINWNRTACRIVKKIDFIHWTSINKINSQSISRNGETDTYSMRYKETAEKPRPNNSLGTDSTNNRLHFL